MIKTISPSWLEPTRKLLSDVLKHPDNFDGYGAKRVRAAKVALKMLRELAPDDLRTVLIRIVTQASMNQAAGCWKQWLA